MSNSTIINSKKFENFLRFIYKFFKSMIKVDFFIKSVINYLKTKFKNLFIKKLKNELNNVFF